MELFILQKDIILGFKATIVLDYDSNESYLYFNPFWSSPYDVKNFFDEIFRKIAKRRIIKK